MSRHRFSNSARVRADVLAKAGFSLYKKWEDVPQNLRYLILLHIQDIIEEVLSENIS